MRSPNRCRRIMFATVMAGLAAALLSVILAGGEEPILLPLFIVGAVAACGGLIWGLVTVRCPSCGRMLDLRGWGNRYCPHCGEKVE